jgi:transcriptional regulator with XRE-family HTH domain
MIRLKWERLARHWTQQDLAFHARLTVSDICRFERGVMKPYPSQAARLGRLLGLSPGQLLEEVDLPLVAAEARHA